jgi:hypothetical protein
MFNQYVSRLMVLIMASLILVGCGFKPMDHQHNARLEKIKMGMTVAEVRHIFPDMKLTHHHGDKSVYRYTEHDLRAISFSGVVKRTVMFHFTHDKLTKWGSDRTRPI